MSKKTRKAAPARNTRKPAALPAPKSTSPETVLPVVGLTGPVVMKLDNSASELASLKLAQAVYIVGREESGLGASELPQGLIYQDGTQVARIAYNGRIFSMSGALISEALELDEALAIAKNADQTPVEPPPATVADASQPEAPKSAEAEQLEPATTITIPASLLAAALAIAPKVEASRPYLAGVFVHQVENDLRMVATDGHRMLVLSVPAGEGKVHTSHAWGKDGVILPAEAMSRIAKYVGKDEGAAIDVSYGIGHPHVGVTEVGGMARFAVQPVSGQYPQYQKVVEQAAGAFTTSREPTETNAVDASYLKSAGVIAAALGAPHVFPFVGNDGACTVFTFSTVPGALLYIMPVRQNSSTAGLQAETVRLIGAAGMAGTISALKAHETRTRTASNNQRLPKEERAKLVEKADAYARRITDIQAACTACLPAPAAAETGTTGEDSDEGVNA